MTDANAPNGHKLAEKETISAAKAHLIWQVLWFKTMIFLTDKPTRLHQIIKWNIMLSKHADRHMVTTTPYHYPQRSMQQYRWRKNIKQVVKYILLFTCYTAGQSSRWYHKKYHTTHQKKTILKNYMQNEKNSLKLEQRLKQY